MSTNRLEFPVVFGKVTYAPGAPKNAPRWVWSCICEKCKALPEPVLRGPFKTSKEAERDAVRMISQLAEGWAGTHH